MIAFVGFMPRNNQPEPEQHKGDTNPEIDDDDDLRATIPDSRVRLPDVEEQEDSEEVDLELEDDDEDDARESHETVDIDIDALPQFEGEGPDA